ncbi:MAG: hypothetical protein IPJ82_19165 [Lewinellaceae bacterium]|nr:hypothetical protein [Lewinellaceae bacterium]
MQKSLFDIILSRYPRRTDAVDALCELLHLSKDPVYRRLRGDTFLTPGEISVLANHYKISLDALVTNGTDHVLCRFNAFSTRVASFEDYLNGFRSDFEQIRRLPNPHLYYASAEVPVFTYSFFPELISFKLYIWGRTIWNLEYLRHRPFDFDLVTHPVIRLSQDVLQHYLSLNSTELWSVHLVDNTLAQIEYHVYSGGFRDPADALTLCDKTADWVAHTRAMAQAGRKFNAGEKPENGQGVFNLYHNEMIYVNITALITSDLGRTVYAAFCNPNFLVSADPKLCDYTESWFGNVLAKSNLISQSAEKSRDWFFRELGKKIGRVKQRILLHVEENRQ